MELYIERQNPPLGAASEGDRLQMTECVKLGSPEYKALSELKEISAMNWDLNRRRVRAFIQWRRRHPYRRQVDVCRQAS